MHENLLTETRKLEVRLAEFLEAEEKAVEALRRCASDLKKLSDVEAELHDKETPECVEEVFTARLEAIRSLHDALTEISKAEHEKSHLFESYGALMQVLEEQLPSVLDKQKKLR